MKFREDHRMSLRSVGKRSAESLLLALGVALSVGATSAGLALAGRTAERSRELLSSTRYREIVVAARETSSEMDLPAVIQESTDRIVLTAADLQAREVVQDVQYAYVASPTVFRLGAFRWQGFQRFDDQSAEQQGAGRASGNRGAQAGSQANATASREAGGSAENPPAEQLSSEREATPTSADRQPPSQFFSREAAAVEVDGPQPVIEEMRGNEISPEFFAAWGLVPAAGSLFTATDITRGEPILVLGARLAEELFEDGESLGRQVLANRQLYRITGILEPTGSEFDLQAFTPARALNLQAFGDITHRFRGFNTNLHFTVADVTRLEEAKAQLGSWFDQVYGPGTISISSPREEAAATADRNQRLAMVILILAFSALLIAAVNVTNIFFSRAVRKRRSVGILKAVGATRRQVFTVFFLEALVIGAVGAAFGAALSALLSKLMEQTIGFGAVQISLLIAGVLGAWAIVAVFNVLPATQAARVPAAEAIRHE